MSQRQMGHGSERAREPALPELLSNSTLALELEIVDIWVAMVLIMCLINFLFFETIFEKTVTFMKPKTVSKMKMIRQLFSL
jgi:hypothetical protein